MNAEGKTTRKARKQRSKQRKGKETFKRRFHFKMGQKIQHQELRYANQPKQTVL